MTASAKRARPPAGFRLLEHTADVGVEAWGRTRQECFDQAVRALAAVVAAPRTPITTRAEAVDIPPGSHEEQLLTLLEAAIYLIDVNGQLPIAAHLAPAPDGGLSGVFDSVAVEDVEQTGSVPKAATRYLLRVRQDDTGWSARATIDV